jgi:glucoamylase
MSISAPEPAAAATSSASGPNAITYRSVAPAAQQSDLATIAQHMFALMLRNVASDGFVFADPNDPGSFSRPGCVIASPSYPQDLSVVNQNYVFNWTRDAAVTAIELISANMPTAQPLIDYVNFAAVCQNSGAPTVARASYTIEGNPRQWSDQSDGPALQTLAMLRAYPLLDAPSQAVAQAVIAKDLAYLLGAYQGSTVNLWEEQTGASFFARAVQLRCLQQIDANTLGIPVPSGTSAAITWLQGALQDHWDGNIYQSILPAPPGYDPNSDVVIAAVYGAVTFTDTKLLATAAQLRSLWADPTSPSFYPINGADQQRGLGPMLGRYPGDSYDGDTQDHVVGGHPWTLCSCHLAEVYYQLATAIAGTQAVPLDSLSAPFFDQVGVGSQTTPAAAVTALQAAGDQILQAVVFHSDNLELSEQFDGSTGFEKSVRNLTWSYAAFLSAVRARTRAGSVQG